MLWKIKAAFGTGIMCKDGLPLEVKFEHLSIHIESEKSNTKASCSFCCKTELNENEIIAIVGHLELP